TITPELTTHFEDNMIVLEKWNPKKPISAIYYNGEKELYYVKRFLIEQAEREESFISDHADSFLELVTTHWLQKIEIEFTKERGKERNPNHGLGLEEFRSIKGINALGNQLTKEKVKQVNLLEPFPYDEPEEVEP